MAAKSFPEVVEKVIGTDPQNNGTTTEFAGPERDGTWTAFFTYVGDDDRFIYGVKKGLSEQDALDYLKKEEARLNAK